MDLSLRMRECRVRADDLRLSTQTPHWSNFPLLTAIVVESIAVPEQSRREGHCKQFIAILCDHPKYDLVVVEGVQNPILRDALIRWGWWHDPVVMDFYWPRTEAAKLAVARPPVVAPQPKETIRDGA